MRSDTGEIKYFNNAEIIPEEFDTSISEKEAALLKEVEAMERVKALMNMRNQQNVNADPKYTKKYAKKPSYNKKKMIKASKKRNRR